MNALVLTQPHQPLELQERPRLSPPAGEVVVRLKAAALNRRDYWITQGMYPGIKTPIILGSDGAGAVTETGTGVDPGWLGKEVVINPGLDWGDDENVQGPEFNILGMPRDGTFATEVVVPASQLYRKPSHLNWEESAALPLAGVTAFRALFTQGALKKNQTVLISGIGGGVATLALQFAVAAGARVWVTSSSPKKIQRAVEHGAEGGFDYKNDGWHRECAKLAGEPNLIIDSAGGDGYATLLSLAAPGGTIVNYGATAGPPARLDLFKLFWKQLRIQGSTMGSPADFAAMLEFAETHGVKPVVDSFSPLSKGNQAVEQMKSSPQFGKCVLRID